MQIPEKLVNFRLYAGVGSLEQVAVATLELPKFEAITETISGAGIAGEYDSPTIGHFKSMVLGINFRVFNPAATLLLVPGQQVLSAYSSVQVQDPQLGTLTVSPWRVDVRGQMKSFDPGKMEMGKPTDQKVEFELAKLVLTYDEKKVVEFDRFNFKFEVNGVDYLAAVRSNIGGA